MELSWGPSWSRVVGPLRPFPGLAEGLKRAPRRLYAIEFAPEVATGAPMSSNGTVRRSPREPPERDGITRRSGRRGLRARGAGAARSEGKQ